MFSIILSQPPEQNSVFLQQPHNLIHELPENNSVVMKLLQGLFAEILICDVFKGNWVMFCGKNALQYNKSEPGRRVKLLA